MDHRIFESDWLYIILFKFVKCPVRHLGLAVARRKCLMCLTFFGHSDIRLLVVDILSSSIENLFHVNATGTEHP